MIISSADGSVLLIWSLTRSAHSRLSALGIVFSVLSYGLIVISGPSSPYSADRINQGAPVPSTSRRALINHADVYRSAARSGSGFFPATQDTRNTFFNMTNHSIDFISIWLSWQSAIQSTNAPVKPAAPITTYYICSSARQSLQQAQSIAAGDGSSGFTAYRGCDSQNGFGPTNLTQQNLTNPCHPLKHPIPSTLYPNSQAREPRLWPLRRT